MTARGIAVAAVLTAITARSAFAAPLVVVVRDNSETALAVTRLRGQLADLDVSLSVARGAIETGLDAQLASASRLAATYSARAVVWFFARRGGLAVAIATPGDHRLFIREIPAADASAVAEAAAVAARSALRAIAEGGTIGVEVPDRELPPPAVIAPVPVVERVPAPARRSFGVAVAVGWQVALDGGAEAGAHAIAQRTTLLSGPWGVLLALSWGPGLHHAVPASSSPGVDVDLSRSSAMLGVERRFGELAIAAAAGAVLYHRTTTATPSDLSATPAANTAAFVAGPELRWQWRPDDGPVGIMAAAALDVVVGAPDPSVMRGTDTASIGAVRLLQPRFMASVFAELR